MTNGKTSRPIFESYTFPTEKRVVFHQRVNTSLPVLKSYFCLPEVSSCGKNRSVVSLYGSWCALRSPENTISPGLSRYISLLDGNSRRAAAGIGIAENYFIPRFFRSLLVSTGIPRRNTEREIRERTLSSDGASLGEGKQRRRDVRAKKKQKKKDRRQGLAVLLQP